MNIIDAVINLVNKPVTEVVSYYKGHNRANNAGEALEEYIKDSSSVFFPKARSDRTYCKH